MHKLVAHRHSVFPELHLGDRHDQIVQACQLFQLLFQTQLVDVRDLG